MDIDEHISAAEARRESDVQDTTLRVFDAQRDEGYPELTLEAGGTTSIIYPAFRTFFEEPNAVLHPSRTHSHFLFCLYEHLISLAVYS